MHDWNCGFLPVTAQPHRGYELQATPQQDVVVGTYRRGDVTSDNQTTTAALPSYIWGLVCWAADVAGQAAGVGEGWQAGQLEVASVDRHNNMLRVRHEERWWQRFAVLLPSSWGDGSCRCYRCAATKGSKLVRRRL